MNANNQPLARAKGTSTLTRAKFGPGMLLQHEDLEQLNVYTRELNRLMFRSLFGCGVVCGLVVSTDVKCGKVNVTVGSGLALDCQGDPIYVPTPQSVCIDEECDPNIPSPLWVVLCRTEKCCAPRASMCSSDDDEAASVCTRERDGFEIRIMRTRPQCTCSCPMEDAADGREYEAWRRREHKSECWCVDPNDPCYRDHYEGKCGCDCEDCEACDCNCVLLARIVRVDNKQDHNPEWEADHHVRRFIRPVLMRDPQVQIEEEKKRKREKEKGKFAQDQQEKDVREEYEQEPHAEEQAAQPTQGAIRATDFRAQGPAAESRSGGARRSRRSPERS